MKRGGRCVRKTFTRWRYWWSNVDSSSVGQVRSLQRHLTLTQLERHVGLHDGLPREDKFALVLDSVARYRDGLKFGRYCFNILYGRSLASSFDCIFLNYGE